MGHRMLNLAASIVMVITILTLTATDASAQKWMLNSGTDTEDHIPHAIPTLDQFPTQELDEYVDVISYDVMVDLRGVLGSMQATDTVLSLVPARAVIDIVISQSATNRFRLHASNSHIILDSCLVDGKQAFIEQSTEELTITVPQEFTDTNRHIVTIYYKIRTVKQDEVGLFVLNGRERVLYDAPYPIAFTFFEPQGARRVFPCHDVSSDKAFFKGSGIVPAGFDFVSNGTLDTAYILSDSSQFFAWHESAPMATYLFVMNASKFAKHHQEYRRSDSTVVPITTYYWDKDFKTTQYDVESSFARVPLMFQRFESTFGRYPFESYGHVVVYPVKWGGMEHQSLTSVNREWLKGRVETGIAHELGHHWMGDLVTCATWGDLWLNEGGATWSEAIWSQENGEFGYISQMFNRRGTYFERDGPSKEPIWNRPMATLFDEATTYCKASWVYHMLRDICSPAIFDSTLRGYFNEYRFTSIQTAEFIEYFKTHVPNPVLPFDIYFDQWLLRRGSPEFYVTQTNSATGTAHVRVDQVQSGDNVPEVFTVYMSVTVVGVDQRQLFDTTFVMNERSVEFSFPTFTEIDTVILDKDRHTLYRRLGTTTNVLDEVASEPLGLYPNPAQNTSSIYVIVPTDMVAAGNARVVVYDLSGRKVLDDSCTSSYTIEPDLLYPGRYNVVVMDGRRSFSTSLIVQ